jgi:hypothetical protein
MPKPQAGGPHLAVCPRLLIQYIRSYPHSWRLSLHPQPEDTPCCGGMVHAGLFLLLHHISIVMYTQHISQIRLITTHIILPSAI